MKDNEFYRPAESGVRAQEMPAARDEFARPQTSAQPKGPRRQHGRLLQLLCGAAAVTVIAQAALPESAAASAFAAPLRWEEITLLGRPAEEVTLEDMISACGAENAHYDQRSYTQETVDGNIIDFRLYEVRRRYSNGGPDAGEHYYTKDWRLTSTSPDLPLKVRGIEIGMDVREAMERVGFSENVWDLLTDLAPEYEKQESALLQAFSKKREELLEEYGIDDLKTPYYLDGYEYTLPYDPAGQSAEGPYHDNTWQIRGRDPYHGEWVVLVMYDYHNEFDCNGDYVRSVSAAALDCSYLQLTFEDGRLTELQVRAVGSPILDDKPEPTSTPEPEETSSGWGLSFPNLLRWEEVTLAGIQFDQVTAEEVERAYPDPNVHLPNTSIREYTLEETNRIDIAYDTDDIQFSITLNQDGEEGYWHRYYNCRKDDGTGPDPEFRGLAMGMDVDEVLRCIGISEEEWALLYNDGNKIFGTNNKEGMEQSINLWYIDTLGVDPYAAEFQLQIAYYYNDKMVTFLFRNGRLASMLLSSRNFQDYYNQ